MGVRYLNSKRNRAHHFYGGALSLSVELFFKWSANRYRLAARGAQNKKADATGASAFFLARLGSRSG